MPTAQGTVNGKKVIALRDTGCTGCVVRRSLVSSDQLLGKESDVTFIDESTQMYPLAVVEIDCPFSQEKLRHYVWMIHYMTLLLEILMGQNFRTCPIFQLRQLLGLKLIRKRLTGNLVPDQIISKDKEAFKQAQESGPKLNGIRQRIESGSVTVSRGLNRGETKFVLKKGLMYRQFTKGNKLTLQLVIPESFREKVLRLAHETLISGHLGIKKTMDRVLTEFFWPGVCGDVSRFCKSYEICQRTNQKGRVTKVPLGKLPLIDTPFKRLAVVKVGPREPRSDEKIDMS